MQSPPSSLSDGKLPVFVFPSSLIFYSDDQSTHKQVLTLYNPYEMALKFKVQCTAPKKYSVIDPEGVVKPRCCVDVVIRHVDICIKHEGVLDKFRIQVYEQGSRKMAGKKEVTSVLYPTRDSQVKSEDTFESLPTVPGGKMGEQLSIPIRPGQSQSTSPSLVIIMAAIACIAALMLPTVGDKNIKVPEYLVLSVNQKLIAAYVLGLVTMVLLRT
ncbi:motile sperm domain-containing protein 1-like [Lingula anatina]|uniref:Motile sperm domain-containing protein 1 n=1 Tax=Lingula anatina TaxID=7574 RepID=A0A1S3K1U7_LINAN|nr:motile sperm domain-containing protein 1-like [Lingula anatina]|eukprot:XP_013416374.1 motile sperm domain-containing protein 1-like [Lingula anatina]